MKKNIIILIIVVIVVAAAGFYGGMLYGKQTAAKTAAVARLIEPVLPVRAARPPARVLPERGLPMARY